MSFVGSVQLSNKLKSEPSLAWVRKEMGYSRWGLGSKISEISKLSLAWAWKEVELPSLTHLDPFRPMLANFDPVGLVSNNFESF